ncbi:MAG: amidohydrolase [Clostridiales bacterium]|nr:amidohydrolase [Clostridiales bacterium]
MLFCNIAVLDENLEYKTNMFVGTRGAYIEYIGAQKPQEDFGEEYMGEGKLLVTAFFNAHCHSSMTLLRGYAENLPLADWLNKKIFPFEAKLTENDVFNGAMLGIAEMLRTGTASFTDMYMFGEGVCAAAAETGMKCNYSSSMVCFDSSAYTDLPVCNETRLLYEKYHGFDDGRLLTDVCIHAEYTSTPAAASGAAEFARERGLNIHLHLSETKAEHEQCRQRHSGMTPAEYFDSLGVFENRVTAAHSVWITDSDAEIIKRAGASIASCPSSNLKLGSGFFRAPYMLDKGVNVALGTDGAASSNNLNMLKEIYLFALIHKGNTLDASVISPRQALYAATKAGAVSQGRSDCGALKVDNRADLTVFDLTAPNMCPMADGADMLVYSAQGDDVIMTMVDGRVLYRDGEYLTLDIEKVRFNAQKSRERIAGELV